MDAIPKETVKEVLGALDVREVLDYLDYRTETIQESGKVVRCFCPIHKEQVFRTLSVDVATRKGKCSYNPCPGHKSFDLIQLVALSKNLEYDEATVELAQHFQLQVKIPGAEKMLRQRLDSASSLLAEGSLEEALEKFSRVLAIEPHNIEALEGMAQICELKRLAPQLVGFQKTLIDLHTGRGDHARAALVYERYVRANPTDVEMRLGYAECLHHLNRKEEMCGELKGIAKVFRDREETDKALEIYRRLRAVDPADAEVPEAIVGILVAEGRADEAIEEMSRQAEEKAASGDLEGAATRYKQILSLDPRRNDVRAAFIEMALDSVGRADEVGRADGAIEQCLGLIDEFAGPEAQNRSLETLESLRRRYPSHVSVLEKLYPLYRSLGRDEEANTLASDLCEAHLAAGRRRLAGPRPLAPGALQEARESFGRVDDLQPDRVDALSALLEVAREAGDGAAVAALLRRLAVVHGNQGAHDQAEAVLREYLRAHPKDMEARLQLAECLHRLGRAEETINVMQGIATSFEESGEVDKALDIYRRIDTLQPGAVDVDGAIARLLVRAGREDEAVEQMTLRAEQLLETNRLEESLLRFQQVLGLAPRRNDVRLKYIRAVLSASAPPTASEADRNALNQCLEIMDGFSGRDAADMTVQALEVLRESFPAEIPLLARLHGAYCRLGRQAEADGLAFDLAQFHLDNQDYPAALEWIEPVIERGGAGLPIALSLKSEICSAMGDIPRTVQTFMQIVDYHENEGQFEEALSFYQSIIDVDAENLAVHHRWLAALMRLGNTEEALSRGQQILPLLSNLEILTETERAERALDILVILSGLDIQAAQPALYLDFILARATVLTRLGREGEAREILLDAAERFADDGDLEKAIEIFNYLLEIDPHDLTAIERLADSRMNLGQEAEALEGYRSLANLYQEQGAPDAQLDVLLKIADVESSNIEVLQQILDLYDGLGNVRDARELRERIIRLHLDQREYPKALAVCRTVLEQDPKDTAILGICVQIHQKTNDAEQLRDDAFRLIDLYRERGETERAGELFSLLESRFPDDPQVLAVRILASCEAGDFDSVLPAVERMVEINDEADRDEHSLAVLRQVLGRPGLSPNAARLLPLWVDLSIRTGTAELNWDVTENLIGFLVLEKRIDEIAEQLRKIVDAAPDFDPAWERLVEILKSEQFSRMALEALRDWARVCGNRGDAEAALRRYQEALQTEPDDVDLLSEILEFRVSAGIRENAADIGLLLAHLLEGMGLVCQAVTALDMALKLEPNRNDLRELALALEELIASPTHLCRRYRDALASQTDQEQFEAAYATITEAIHRFPLDAGFRRSKIDLLKRLGSQEAAIAELGNLSAILAELGRPAEAQKAIDEILELDPANSEARSLEAEIRSLAGPAQPTGRISTVSLGDGRGAEEDSGRPSRLLSVMKEYSFDDFIVGARNNFAYATALAISKSPGGDYNPLFLHGDVGLGKTHLLHAIANYILEHSKGTRILYTSSEDFTNALIEAIQNNTIKEFRALHKSPDVLLVDDVHFLAEKERAQEEFFQIFNSLYQANRQIVMTSDRPPKEIAHLERRLRSRFGAGIIVDIQSPDLETRVAILRREAGRAQAEIDDGILIHIAQRIESNVRELKGALTQIIAHVRIAQEEPTEELVKQVVSQVRGTG